MLSGIASAYGIAWRVFDAQYAGLAQRRERVFLVGYLGDWRAAAAVLLEHESLSGNLAPSRGQGEDVAPGPVSSLDASYGRLQGASGQDANHGHNHLVAGTLRATQGGPDVDHAQANHFIAFGGNNTAGPIELATAVRAHGSFHGDFESETLLAGTVRTHTRPGSDTVGSIVAGTLTGGGRKKGGQSLDDVPLVHSPAMVFQARDVDRVDTQNELAYALTATGGDGGRRGEMNVLAPMAFQSQMSGTQVATEQPTSPTINAVSRMAVAFKASHFTRDKDGATEFGAPSLSADADKGDQDTLICTPYAFEQRIGRNGRGDHGDVTGPLMAQAGADGRGDAAPCVATGMAVRRFTPLECERLQGFPDHYTFIPFRHRKAKDHEEWFEYLRGWFIQITEADALQAVADGPRYKSIGNSWAITCVTWLGQRIEHVEAAMRFSGALGNISLDL